MELEPRVIRFGLVDEYIIWEYERGLLFRNGQFERILEPGRYRFTKFPSPEQIRIVAVSLRQMSEVINSQAILTADKIEVRVSLIAQYAVVDPLLAISAVDSYSDRLYQDLQLTLRDLVSGYEIDALLEARAELSDTLLADVAPRAEGYGVELSRVGIRDIVLPGSVRSVFLREVEADREGRAELVKARHEVAAARARANTARILSRNPNIARMQELDTLVKLAGRNGSVVLLPNLSDLFVPRGVAVGENGADATEDDEA
ncbi:MAG: slipin family protein [Chloroflexi bacterium]|nr:slipin family protein [Chloroflexota bacterium]